MTEYLKLWVEGNEDNYLLCETPEQVKEAVDAFWESGKAYGKTVRGQVLEMTEAEYQAVPATNVPWWQEAPDA